MGFFLLILLHLFFFLIKTIERNQTIILFYFLLKTECHVNIEESQKNTKMNSSISHIYNSK
jgi:hypothetical protein